MVFLSKTNLKSTLSPPTEIYGTGKFYIEDVFATAPVGKLEGGTTGAPPTFIFILLKFILDAAVFVLS